MTIYEAVGGQATFEQLVDAFYSGVAEDPILRPLYPDELEGPKRRLTLFLIQFFGGPATYSDERGEPALRMRHLPFAIGPAERDAWLQRMAAAIDTLALPDLAKGQFRGYFEGAANFLMNRPA